MSWRNGALLVAEIWPAIQTRIRDKKHRAEFTVGLLRLMLESDLDPQDVSDIHPEIRDALARLGAATEIDEPDPTVALCIAQLAAPDPVARATAAEALRDVTNPGLAADDAAVLSALIESLKDADTKVRHQAALSIRVLVKAGLQTTPAIVKKLKVAARDIDTTVAKRIADALSIIEHRGSK